jgi:hypothetical protein
LVLIKKTPCQRGVFFIFSLVKGIDFFKKKSNFIVIAFIFLGECLMIKKIFILIALAAFLSACGGGGSSAAPSSSGSPGSGSGSDSSSGSSGTGTGMNVPGSFQAIDT